MAALNPSAATWVPNPHDGPPRQARDDDDDDQDERRAEGLETKKAQAATASSSSPSSRGPVSSEKEEAGEATEAARDGVSVPGTKAASSSTTTADAASSPDANDDEDVAATVVVVAATGAEAATLRAEASLDADAQPAAKPLCGERESGDATPNKPRDEVDEAPTSVTHLKRAEATTEGTTPPPPPRAAAPPSPPLTTTKKTHHHPRSSSTASGLTTTPSRRPVNTGGTVRPEDFVMLLEIGSGAFGRVTKVEHAPTRRHYAMKAISKKVLRKKKVAQKEWRLERDVLVKIEPHPYVVELVCAFQTASSFYLVMTYLPGGELFDFLRSRGFFEEAVAAFYAAETTLALEHLHASGIIHRDLKPENLLLDAQGHVVVTDFGLAKIFQSHDEVHRTLCGTDAYMAPEMVARRSYGRAVDLWSLGVLVFEMLAGKPPFSGKDTKDLHRKILTEKVKFPTFFSSIAVTCLRGLLERQVPKRLGATKTTMFEVGGVDALKNHAFFKRIEWQPLARRESPAPLRVSPLEQRLLLQQQQQLQNATETTETNGPLTSSCNPGGKTHTNGQPPSLKILNKRVNADDASDAASRGGPQNADAASSRVSDSDGASTVADFEYCRDDRFESFRNVFEDDDLDDNGDDDDDDAPDLLLFADADREEEEQRGSLRTPRRVTRKDDPLRFRTNTDERADKTFAAPLRRDRLESPTSSQCDVSSSCASDRAVCFALSGDRLLSASSANSARPKKPRPPRKRKKQQPLSNNTADKKPPLFVAPSDKTAVDVDGRPAVANDSNGVAGVTRKHNLQHSILTSSSSSSVGRPLLESIPDSPARGSHAADAAAATPGTSNCGPTTSSSSGATSATLPKQRTLRLGPPRR